MERPLSSLVFNGSIIEAIAEAKQQKKLFLVYVSGGNMESNQLDASTWPDPRVADSISKYCILLHILEESTDAKNFSALYPQKAAPCITAIGYNGVQLWQHEGFVSADNLASSLEKAWLSLHVQETTATFLTAALASKKELVPGASSVTSEVGSSSNAQVSSAQAETQIQSSMATSSNNNQIVEEEDRGRAATEIDSLVIDMASHGSADAFESRVGEFNESTGAITIAEKPLDLVGVDSTKTIGAYSMSKENPDLHDQLMYPNEEAPGEIAKKARKGPEIKIVEGAAAEKADFSDASSNRSHDVYLNIRLPSGSSLQVKFLVMDTLRMVKDYVDKNQTSSFGSYDLAVPYPRKVFGDGDLDRTLSDLGLHNRQALIIVRHNKVNVTPLHGQSSSAESNHSAIGFNEGYFSMIRRLFSYVNPLSYLGGSSNTSDTAQGSQNSIWQYGPNPTPQNNQTLARKPYQTPITSTSNNRSTKPASSRFGSNIHTLKHDEDENQFGDKNTFWNGNSTQFGGDDNSK
ncbi:plant UBX domain-containing protein 11 [Nicotiana tabacum]|uniref:Plant UBX domain-containing protein 11 n=3 Tax=Nicotiana TaxID=4085 RepID=A0AC58UTW8_TOBAC|nr:PREDICTED: UBX domain-containing protein 4 isoform X1 [Nicotiana sylvestris]XP_016481332.1 PREDICTED: plant UBX domain-containing protein 11-like isoform X1 [Nicotiana tabacum]